MDENRLEKFTFYEIYATIIDEMKDEEAGRMIKRICLPDGNWERRKSGRKRGERTEP